MSYALLLSIAMAGLLAFATLGERSESAIAGTSTSPAPPFRRGGAETERGSLPTLGAQSWSGMASSFARGARATGRFSDDAAQALELARYRRLAVAWLDHSELYPTSLIEPLLAEFGSARTRRFIENNVPSEYSARLHAYEALAKLEGPNSAVWSNVLDEINQLEDPYGRVWYRTKVLEAQGDAFSRWPELLADLKRLNNEDAAMRIEDLVAAVSQHPAESGLFEHTLGLVLKQPKAATRAEHLTALAKAQGEGSTIWDDAIAAAQKVPNANQRNKALLDVFRAGGPRRVLEVALENAREPLDAGDPMATIRLSVSIAEAEGPQSPAWDLAIEAERQLEDGRRLAFQVAREHGPQSPAWREAFEFAKAQTKPDVRSAALLNIAAEKPHGIDVLPDLLAALDESKRDRARAFRLVKTAKIYSGHEQVVHAAFEAIHALESPSEQRKLFVMMAQALGPKSPAFDEAVRHLRVARSTDPTASIRIMAELAQRQGDASPLWRELESWLKEGSFSLQEIAAVGKQHGPSSFAWPALVDQASRHPLKPRERALLTQAARNQPELAQKLYRLSKTWPIDDSERLPWLKKFVLAVPSFTPAWDELFTILPKLDWQSRIKTLLKLTEEQPENPVFWRQLMETLADDVPHDERAIHESRAGQLLLKRTRTPSVGEPDGSLTELAHAAGRSEDQMRALGNLLITRGDDFSELSDPWSRSQLLRGASEVHRFLTERERAGLRQQVIDALRSAEAKGRFEGAQHLSELTALGESLLLLDDNGSQSILFKLLRAHEEDQAGLQILHLLGRVGNQRAINMLLERALGPDSFQTNAQQTRRIIRRLVQNDALEPELPGLIDSWAQEGIPPDNSYQIMRTLFQEAGALPDPDSLRWLRNQLENADLDLSLPSSTEIDRFLKSRLRDWREQIAVLDGYNSSKLLRTLDADEDLRMKYFFLKSQRSTYAQVPRTTYASFQHAIEATREVESRVDASLFRKDTVPNAGFHQALLERRRPRGDMVWRTTLTQSKAEVQANLVTDLRSTLRDEPFWLANAGRGGHNLADLQATAVPETFFRTLRGTLGQDLTAILEEGSSPTSLSRNDFAVAKKTLIARIRTLQKQASEPERIRAWKAVRRSVEESDSDVMALRHVLAVLSDDPDATLKPKGAVNEWISHLDAIDQALDDLQDATDRERTVTLRYLDGDEDFVDMLRFADGAACCFTTKNTIGDLMDTKNQWKSRINRDPHWFVIQIEETDPDAIVRQSSGFVFGSFALVDNRPALALNGVYLQNKTDRAVAAIVDGIYERVAKPAGIDQVAVATSYGGSAKLDPDKWTRAIGHTLERPRAIRDATGVPETQIYDDLGTTVNQPVRLSGDSQIFIRDYAKNGL